MFFTFPNITSHKISHHNLSEIYQPKTFFIDLIQKYQTRHLIAHPRYPLSKISHKKVNLNPNKSNPQMVLSSFILSFNFFQPSRSSILLKFFIHLKTNQIDRLKFLTKNSSKYLTQASQTKKSTNCLKENLS